MSLTTQEIKEILELLEASGWDEAQVTVGDVTITVSKHGSGGPGSRSGEAVGGEATAAPTFAADSEPASSHRGSPAPPPAHAANGAGNDGGAAIAPGLEGASARAPVAEADQRAAALSTAVAGAEICSPSVGIFWRAPEPGAAPYVAVGDDVTAGQTLCIVEVMKLMQHVMAEVDGVVAAVHVENGEHVEYGQALFTIAPAGA